MMHICRSWTPPDPFAPACGCVLLPCGHVDMEAATTAGCNQHSVTASRSIRSGHDDVQSPYRDQT